MMQASNQTANQAAGAILEEATIVLTKPITIGKGDAAVTYSELQLREPTAGEWNKACKAGDVNDVVSSLTVQVSGAPKQVVEAIGMRNFNECFDFFAQFCSQLKT